MRFLLDQSTDARLLSFLAERGHDATRIGWDYPHGLPDPDVLKIARQEQRVLITDDRDFGELAIPLQMPHAGIILLRLGDEVGLETKIDRLAHVLDHYANELDHFLVVTRDRVRVRRTIERT